MSRGRGLWGGGGMGESGLDGGCGVFGEGLRVGWEGFRLGFEGGFEVVLSSVQHFHIC